MNAITNALSERKLSHNRASPHACVRIADEALAENDLTTAARFVEMAYEAFDEAQAMGGTCLCTWAAISADVAIADGNAEAASLHLERAFSAMDNVQMSDVLQWPLAVASED